VTVLALVASAVIALDVFTKELVLVLLEPGRFVPLLGPSVGWQLLFNPGAAFGLRLPPVVFPVVTVALIVFVLRSLGEVPGTGAVVAQGLVIGGAVGNVIDRFVRPGDGSLVGGHVVDFVAWGSFPRFNVADASITVGVALFILLTFLAERVERAERSAGPDAPDAPDASDAG
jgi:signal peptidase II